VRHGNPDANQGDIVQALRKVGAVVVLLTVLGDGIPDLLVGFRGETFLLEVKTAKGRLEEAQEVFIATWRGRPVRVVRTVDEAFAAIGLTARAA
jgi:hypothetical protein